METTNYVSFILTSIVLILTPGPDLIYSLYAGLHGGKNAAICAAAGFAFGNIFHLAMVYLGISGLMILYPNIKSFILIIGAIYMFYLAYMSYKSSMSEITEIINVSNNYFKQAILMNILNPKVMFFFLAFFPSFLPKDNQSNNVILILGAIFISLVFIIFSFLGISFSSIGYKVLLKSNLKKYFEIASAVLFFAIGLRILLTSNVFI